MVKKKRNIGILSLQGDFEKHFHTLLALNQNPVYIRYPEQLKSIDGLIIPGGESTTIGKLLNRQHLIDPIKKKIELSDNEIKCHA